MGPISIRTSNFEQSVSDAQQVLGLRETRRTEGVSYLAASDVHHELTYVESDIDGLEALGLIAPNGDALREIRRRIEDQNLKVVSETPTGEGVEDGFTFIGPEGFAFEVSTGLAKAKAPSLGFGPQRYGHFNFHPQDHFGMVDFLTKVLDFRVSDVIGTGGSKGFFLRCNAEHHGIAVLKGRGTFHHHAWQVQSVTDLTKTADRLKRLGRELLWGPVRHGAGDNIAIYYKEHSGNVVELYVDMEMIYDDNRPPVEWLDGEVWWNQWNSYVPDGFRSLGLAPTALAVR
ncbi:VOC family protein [Paenarthrobacter nicotinovorans]|uniref:VOC family protein n=1 Tax=Paenarthrobacter nicotinovorans TaxID=29320 RepID=UPI0037F8B291